MFARTKRPDWEPSIAQLRASLDNMRTNEPINRREGRKAQADLEKQNGASYNAVIKMLEKGR